MPKSVKHDDREHAPLPPSASSRWLKCPPSMAYVKDLIKRKIIKKRESGEAAKRGTRIHEIAAPAILALIKGKRAVYPKGEEGQIAKQYAEFCFKLYEEALLMDDETRYGIEAEAWIDDMCWGSCDFWILSGGRLIVVDLKTGKQSVLAMDNTQLLIYAIGVMRKHKLPPPKDYDLVIYQPGNGPNDHDKWPYENRQIFAWVKDITKGIADATKYFKDKKPDFEAGMVAGDHCEWCDALGVCPKAKTRALSISSANFAPVSIERSTPPPPARLEPDQIAQILERAPMFEAWIGAVRVRALELAQKGHRIPGFKIVPKITRRAWESKAKPAAIAKGVGLRLDEIQETRMKSPAEVEKLLHGKDKKKVDRFTFKPIGEPTVVAESDKRLAIPSTKISFTPVSNSEDDDG